MYLTDVFFHKQKRNLTKPNVGKNNHAAKRKGQQKGKKTAKRTIVKAKVPVSRNNLRTKLVRTALKTAELLRAQEKSEQAANMVYGNDENIGMQ